MGTEASVAAGQLARSLAAMKRRGCWLLVTGREAGCEHGRACRRLLGDAAERPRRRVVVETTGRLGVAREADVRIEVTGGSVRRSEMLAGDRATGDGVHGRGSPRTEYGPYTPDEPATSDGPSTPDGPATSDGPYTPDEPATSDGPYTPDGPTTSDGPHAPAGPAERVPRSDLPALADVCRERVEDLRASADLAPAELRLCVDSLVPLVAANDVGAVASLVELVGDGVRAARGMGHVHLPARPDCSPVRRLWPLFDAVVEVRTRRGRVEHRWHVRDVDVTSGWLEL